MEKPITVKADELAQGIAYLANNSGLPAFIVAGILNDLYLEARKLASQQLRKDNDGPKLTINGHFMGNSVCF